jgi:hypothetical protein
VLHFLDFMALKIKRLSRVRRAEGQSAKLPLSAKSGIRPGLPKAPSARSDPGVDASCVSRAQQGRTRTRSSRGIFAIGHWPADVRSRDGAWFCITLP